MYYTCVHAAGQGCAQQAFGPCSQQCAESGSALYGYLCSCLPGYSLQRDERTCLANGEYSIVGTFVLKLQLNALVKQWASRR